ncbi:NAD(P)-dependent dehydrogenase (short-subunit alcohol dehydrogenase family) [Paraburkholderia youngii]
MEGAALESNTSWAKCSCHSASGGIGAAIVEGLALEGARPVIHYERDRKKAEALLERIGGNGFIVQGDLATSDGAFELWRASIQAADRIHGLVNNAGIRTEISVDSEPDEWRAVWQKEFQVNVFGAANLCREAIRHFRQNGGGRIVNMSTRAGQRGYAADAMPYGATKAALANLSKSIARSFGADGVTAVNLARMGFHRDSRGLHRKAWQVVGRCRYSNWRDCHSVGNCRTCLLCIETVTSFP